MNTRNLTNEEIFEVQFCWKHMEDTSYLETALESSNLEPYLSALKDHPIIEIGPGNNPVNEHYPCKEYAAAYGRYPNDGLSILRKEEDSSAIVVSFGVMDYCVLKGKGFGLKNSDLSSRYIEELVGEIKRVINPFGIIIGLNAKEYMGVPDVLAFTHWDKVGGVYFPKHQG